MMPFLDKLLAYHQAFWMFDPWYRRSWYAGPPAAAVTAAALLLMSSPTAPQSAQWAKPVANPATAPANDDLQICNDAKTDYVPRGQACDRLISRGGLSSNDLAAAHFGRGWWKFNTKDYAAATTDFTQTIKYDPTHAIAYNNRGAIHLEKKEYDAALRDFDEAARIAPKDALALSNKAEVLRLQGKLSVAQAEVRKALDADRDSARARSVQDAILADIRKLEGARQPDIKATPDFKLCMDTQANVGPRGEACDRLIKQGALTGADMSGAYFGRGYSRRVNKDDAGALMDYSEAIKLYPSHPGAYNNRGNVFLDRNELGAALSDFNEALRIAPKDAMVLSNKAEVLRRQGNLAAAQVEIRKALDIDAKLNRALSIQEAIAADMKRPGGPNQTGVNNVPLPGADNNAIRQRATRHIDNKDYDSAIADMTEVIRQGAATWIDYSVRGRAYLGKGQNAQAVTDFDRAISGAGHGPEVHYNRALAHERLGDLMKAKSDLEEAIGPHGSTDPDYFINLGRVYTAMSNHAQATLAYDKLVEVYSKGKDIKSNLVANALFLRGRSKRSEVVAARSRCKDQIPPDPSCMDPRRFLLALADIQEALVYVPAYSDAHFEKAWIAAEVGNPQQAVESYSAAIKASPTSVAHSNRGVQYEKVRQPELAFADYNEAIRIDPNNKFAWANRGVLFAANRQRQRAIDDLRKAISIDPKYDYAIRELQRLGGRP